MIDGEIRTVAFSSISHLDVCVQFSLYPYNQIDMYCIVHD